MMSYHVLRYAVVAVALSNFCVQALSEDLNFEALPLTTLFPGPWERNIKAPKNKTYIEPVEVYKTEGSVSDAHVLLAGIEHKRSLTLVPGDLVSLEFAENIAGRYAYFKHFM